MAGYPRGRKGGRREIHRRRVQAHRTRMLVRANDARSQPQGDGRGRQGIDQALRQGQEQQCLIQTHSVPARGRQPTSFSSTGHPPPFIVTFTPRPHESEGSTPRPSGLRKGNSGREDGRRPRIHQAVHR